jgi:tetratricopeptide (TPR) repeat protein
MLKPSLLNAVFLLYFLGIYNFLNAQIQEDKRPLEKDIQQEKSFVEAVKEKILGNKEEAITKFKEILAKDPQNAVVLYELATLYKSQNEYDLALTSITKAIESDKTKILYVDFCVKLLEQNGQYEKAAQLYAELLETYPDNQKLYLDCAYYWNKANNGDQAIKVYNSLEKKTGPNPDLISKKIKIYYSLKKDKKAIQELENLIEKYPNEIAYPGYLARYYKDNNKPAESRKYFERVLKIAPNNPDANLSMLDIYRQEGDTLKFVNSMQIVFDNNLLIPSAKWLVLEPVTQGLLKSGKSTYKEQILSLVQKMATAHPDFIPAINVYAKLMMLEARYPEALSALENLLAFDKSKSEIWIQLLNAYKKGHNDSAFISKSAAFLDLYPDQAIGHYFRGIALNKISDFTAAQKSLKRAIEMSYGDDNLSALAKSAIAVTFTALNDKQKAESNINDALKMAPGNIEIIADYCRILLLRNTDLEKVEGFCSKELENNSSNIEFQALMARHLHLKSKYAEAKKYYDNLLKINNLSDIQILEECGDNLYKAGDKTEAQTLWKKALKLGSISTVLKKKAESGIMD